jgi:SAM-dependent methyltransferase
MIAFSAQHFVRPNLRFAVADVRSMPYRNEFDLIVSFNALHWVPEQDVALRSIRAALQPHGRTLLQFVSRGERVALEQVIEDTRQAPRWAGYFAGFRKPFIHLAPAEYRTLAEQTGFQVVQLTVADHSWDFGSREAFNAFCHATFVEWTQRLPETEHAPFIDAVLDAYAKAAATTPAEANTFKFYQMVAILTSA